VSHRADSRDTREDQTILAALEELSAREPFAGPRTLPRHGEDDTDETLRRLYTEVLGLLPYELDPVEPRGEVREALMARLAELREKHADGAGGAVVPFGDSDRAAAGGAPGAPASPSDRRWRFAAGLAAGIALVSLVGALFLGLRLGQAETRLARAEVEREALLERLDDLDDAQVSRAALERQLSQLGEAMTVATTRGVEVCALRPAGDEPLQPESFAVLFMSPDGHWYLNANGLDRPTAGAVYKVWLNTAAGVVDAGVLDPQGRTDLHLGADALGQEMMLSVAVTMEEDAHAAAPQGPMVLYGDDKMQVL
jgi:hypothetical protein